MLRKIVILFGLISLADCAGMPGTISERTTQFDGAKEISLEPGFIKGGGTFGSSDIRLGLFHRSTMSESELLLIVYYGGMAPFDKLMLNIDGQISILDLYGNLEVAVNSHTHRSFYSGRYKITRKFLEQMIRGKQVIVRLGLGSKYDEGLFTFDQMSFAYRGFKEFYKQLYKTDI